MLHRQYFILDADSNGNPISGEEWGNMVFPGTNLVMSALVEQLGTQSRVNQCPRIGCNGLGVTKDRPAFKTWYEIAPCGIVTTDCNSDQCGMEFAAERSINLSSAKRKPDRTLERRGATSQSSRSKQPRGNRASPRKQRSEQDGPPEGDLEESEFWEKSSEPSEQTKRELVVFRRCWRQCD